jgi:hypothetical protein
MVRYCCGYSAEKAKEDRKSKPEVLFYFYEPGVCLSIKLSLRRTLLRSYGLSSKSKKSLRIFVLPITESASHRTKAISQTWLGWCSQCRTLGTKGKSTIAVCCWCSIRIRGYAEHQQRREIEKIQPGLLITASKKMRIYPSASIAASPLLAAILYFSFSFPILRMS